LAVSFSRLLDRPASASFNFRTCLFTIDPQRSVLLFREACLTLRMSGAHTT
jgi:hypothetical protein